MATTKTLSILHRCSVAPASDAAELRLPLTYLDMFWIYFHPIERLFFYKHPCSAADFMEKIAPHLKNSLSQALGHYLPLAGNLYHPTDSSMPELRYFSGDSVAFTLAESSETARFDHLTGDHPREADEFHLFVPKLPESTTDSSGDKKSPLLAIQVTHFPDTGIVVGVTNHHVAGDASSIVGFLKAWSSTARLGGEAEFEKPFYDRSVLRDPTRRAEIYWKQMQSYKVGESKPGSITPTNKVRATFILQRSDIERLKKLVLEREPDSIHLSSFTVTIAYFWSCLDRSTAEAGEEIGDDDVEYFGFAVDARGRVDPPLPAAYFGNCVGFVVSEATHHGEIKGEGGFIAAARIVGELIRDKVNKKGELLSDADEWLVKYAPLLGKRVFGVAGSPRFDVYGVDFGWGKAAKCEAVSIDSDPNASISLCKSREFEGGLELGVSMSKRAVDAFAAEFNRGLKV